MVAGWLAFCALSWYHSWLIVNGATKWKNGSMDPIVLIVVFTVTTTAALYHPTPPPPPRPAQEKVNGSRVSRCW